MSGGSGIKIAWDFGDNNPYTYEDLPGLYHFMVSSLSFFSSSSSSSSSQAPRYQQQDWLIVMTTPSHGALYFKSTLVTSQTYQHPHKPPFNMTPFNHTQTSISNALSSHNFSCDVIVYGKIENVTLLGSEAVNFMNGMGQPFLLFLFKSKLKRSTYVVILPTNHNTVFKNNSI